MISPVSCASAAMFRRIVYLVASHCHGGRVVAATFSRISVGTERSFGTRDASK